MVSCGVPLSTLMSGGDEDGGGCVGALAAFESFRFLSCLGTTIPSPIDRVRCNSFGSLSVIG